MFKKILEALFRSGGDRQTVEAVKDRTRRKVAEAHAKREAAAAEKQAAIEAAKFEEGAKTSPTSIDEQSNPNDATPLEESPRADPEHEAHVRRMFAMLQERFDNSKPMLRPELQDVMREEIEKCGLSCIADEIIVPTRECVILIAADEAVSEDDLLASRFSGDPALPSEQDWPVVNWMGTIDGKPQPERVANFFFQANCAEIPRFHGSLLPESGLLSVFLDYLEDAISPGVVTKYFEQLDPLVHVAEPPRSKLIYDSYSYQEGGDLLPKRLSPQVAASLFGEDWYLDWLDALYFERTGTKKQDIHHGPASDFYFENLILSADGYLDGAAIVQIGGHPGPFSELERQILAALDGDENLYDDLEWRLPHSLNWELSEARLFMMIHSRDEVGLNMWDAGTLTLYMTKENLGARRFDLYASELESG